MNYKLEGALKKSKPRIIIAVILWLIIAIVLIMPITCGKFQIELLQKANSDKDLLNEFFNVFYKALSKPLLGFKMVFKHGLVLKYLKDLIIFTLFYAIFVIFSIIKLMPKHRYDNIEHGSSDWSSGGEQYKILSKKSGIILAENNYLPLDKRGNINVLVVGGSGSGKSASYSIPNAFQMLLLIQKENYMIKQQVI